MVSTSNRPKLFVLLLVLVTTVGYSQSRDDPTAFGDYLYARGDYYRAISAYELARFQGYSKQLPELVASSTMKIGLAYFRADRPLDAINELSVVESSDNLRVGGEHLPLYLSLCYLRMENYELATYYIDEWKANTPSAGPVYVGFLAAKQRRYDDALQSFERASSENVFDAEALSHSIAITREYGESNSRSPFLAGLLSAVFPGAGQLYSGHLYDGVQAFAMVSVLTGITYAMYRYDSEVRGGYVYFPISLGVTALFHASNIWGAARTARYRNERLRTDYLKELRRTIMDEPLPGEQRW
jgi:tetratricopeptide (TPR) repeat protein